MSFYDGLVCQIYALFLVKREENGNHYDMVNS